MDENLRVQIADNALTRDLFPEDYSCLGDNENRPIKWLALESLVNKQFSTASDVVSKGILLPLQAAFHCLQLIRELYFTVFEEGQNNNIQF